MRTYSATMPAKALTLSPALVVALCGAPLTCACTSSVRDQNPPASSGTAAAPASGGTTDASGGASSAGRGASTAAAGAPASGGASSTIIPEAYDSVARRLTRRELANVLRDVLAEDTDPAGRFLLEEEYVPYDNDHTLQTASQALIDALNALAEDVAARALADPARRAQLVPCTPSSAGDAVCFRAVVETLGARLFRRPLAEQEVQRYLPLLAFATEDDPAVDNDFYTAVELFLRSVLQDPEFLYRIEVGTPTSTPGIALLDSFEIAARLSFLVTGSAPDAALARDANGGVLGDPASRRRAAERLLATDAARTQLHRYHAMWLGYRTIPHPAALTAAFNVETSALIDRVVFEENRDYLELFTFPETYVDATLAQHYGLSGPRSASGWVPYGATGRAGLLSHGSVLSAFSKFSDTSPTQRGLLIQTRLLCQDIAPPPANVNVDQPPGEGTAACKVERYAEHRTGSCAGCHGALDPIGLGLEQYDMAGRFREHDDGAPACRLDGQGELPGFGAFSGPGELGQRLAESGRLDACAVQQYVAFAIGHRPSASEGPRVQEAVQRFRANGRDFEELILDFVADPAFALRKEPAL